MAVGFKTPNGRLKRPRLRYTKSVGLFTTGQQVLGCRRKWAIGSLRVHSEDEYTVVAELVLVVLQVTSERGRFRVRWSKIQRGEYEVNGGQLWLNLGLSLSRVWCAGMASQMQPRSQEGVEQTRWANWTDGQKRQQVSQVSKCVQVTDCRNKQH